MASNYSEQCLAVLDLLKRKKNVLVSGAPGTGKSRLLNEVAEAFLTNPITTVPVGSPIHNPSSSVPIPKIAPPIDTKLQNILPGPSRTDRKVFRTVFHQNSKYREFVTGVVPVTNGTGFKVIEGTLYRASEHGKQKSGSSLLIIDEINRGPAVQIFGGSIVAIEPEKRLPENNIPKQNTQYFEVIDPNTGDIIEYCLPEHLYILAAMNQADASVEPLDVAFLRRWAPFRLKPDSKPIRIRYSLTTTSTTALPDVPTSALEVYEAGIQAWEAINSRIKVGRGSEFEIGQGMFLSNEIKTITSLDDSLKEMVEIWEQLYSHIEEIFFGDNRGIAYVLNIGEDHPLELKETIFAGEHRIVIDGLEKINDKNIYSLLRKISKET